MRHYFNVTQPNHIYLQCSFGSVGGKFIVNGGKVQGGFPKASYLQGVSFSWGVSVPALTQITAPFRKQCGVRVLVSTVHWVAIPPSHLIIPPGCPRRSSLPQKPSPLLSLSTSTSAHQMPVCSLCLISPPMNLDFLLLPIFPGSSTKWFCQGCKSKPQLPPRNERRKAAE